MILPERDPNTGLPVVQETRVTGGKWKSLPKWAQEVVNPKEPEQAGQWAPSYLEWQGPTLHRLLCWKCGKDLFGWRVVIDRYGNLVEKNGKQCLWLRAYDHYTFTSVTVRWGCLNKLAIFDALHCKDCLLEAADLPKLVAIFLAGHALMLEHGWANDLPVTMNRHTWATYVYRWSDDPAIKMEPIGLNHTTREVAMILPTPGKPMYPSDYLQIGEVLQASKFWPGMVIEYDPTLDPPPGWTVGPREGTIRKL